MDREHSSKGSYPSGGIARIHVVEDHEKFGQKLRLFINTLDGFTCQGLSADGESAVEAILKEPPDIALIDLTLPGMDGMSLIARLRKEVPSVRCLLISGHTEPEHARSAIASGASGYVVKGNPTDLEKSLRIVLANGTYLPREMRAG